MLHSLENMGLKVTRATKSTISVAHPAMKRNVRLKGTIYEEGFQGLSQRAHLIEDRQRDYDRTEESRGLRDLITWRKGMEIKKDYHQALYIDIKAPEPSELVIKEVVSSNQIQPCIPQRPRNPRP